ncbi:ABC transporter ATP-binding protein [Microterricola viridarii]|uniref:Sugar ABC transporter n=1 Tax=Microterricola viridarii TaxID=412690 RepID=A0A0Y0MTP5_9MICO|nr:ABC transporter ATP-binding protein [Microterricola viridarii]AMB57832.1 sugar ABC transporter [Microterricola viridarii]
MTNPTLVSVNDVSKRFVMHKDKSLKERTLNFQSARKHRDDFWALRDIDLNIELGSTVGLVGHNGSGKSTLLKVIGGILQPTSGTVSRRGRLAALLELGAGFHQDLTGRENVYLNAAILGLSRKDTDKYFDAIVDFSGIESFIDTQVKFYSSGMYVRLAFAVAVHVDPDLLLVDEVLAVGDEPFQRKCMEKIAQFQTEGRTIVLVSHSADQVGSLCDRVVVLNGGVMQYDGEPSEGIRILRNGYEDVRRHDLAAHSTGPKGLAYEIADFSVDTEMHGDTAQLTARLSVDINDPTPDWGVGFSIENTLGLQLYNMTTFDQITLPNTVGRHELTFSIPDLRVGPGKYLINIGLGNKAGQNFDLKTPAGSFDVRGTDYGNGILRLTPSVSVTG